MDHEIADLCRSSRRLSLDRAEYVRNMAATGKKLRADRLGPILIDPAKDPFLMRLDSEAQLWASMAKLYEDDLLAAGEPLE